MAQAIPCAICQEVPEADYIVSLRPEGLLGMGPGTLGICAQCMVQFSVDRMTEWLERVEIPAEAEEAGPGALEAVEAEEGPVEVRAERAPRKRKAPAAPESNGAEVSEEAEASHVDG